MLRKADVWVVIYGFGRGQQNEAGFRAVEVLGAANQLLADALALVGNTDGEVGEVGGVGEVGQRTGDADQEVAIPGRYDEIGVLEHPGHALAIARGAALSEGGGMVQLDKLIEIEVVSRAVLDHGRGWCERGGS